jgi:hypothetical protein
METIQFTFSAVEMPKTVGEFYKLVADKITEFEANADHGIFLTAPNGNHAELTVEHDKENLGGFVVTFSYEGYSPKIV